MEQFLYTDRRTDGRTDTTKHYSPQTIRNGWGLTIKARSLTFDDSLACLPHNAIMTIVIII